MSFPGEKARWGMGQIIFILLSIMGFGLVYAHYGSYLYYYLVYNFGFPTSQIAEFALAYALQFLVTVLAVLIAVFSSRSTLGDLGFKSREWHKVLIWGIAGGIALFFLITAVGYIIQVLIPQLKPQAFEEVLRKADSVRHLLLLLGIGAIAAPLAEEMFFRGVVYPVFRRYFGIRWGIVVSGVFFGLLHWDIWRLVPLALGGMALAYFYERSQTIYVPWIAHGIWNGAMALVVYLS